jgi:hypothetical protein
MQISTDSKPFARIISAVISRRFQTLFLFILTSTFVFAHSAIATTIIAIRTDKEIFLGTDSKIKIERDRPTTQCKIRQIGDLYIAFTGKPVLIKYKFDAYDIAAKAFSTKGTVADKVTVLEKELQKRMEPALDAMRNSDAATFNKWYAEDVKDRMALQVIVAGNQDGIPVLCTLEYRINSPRDSRVSFKSTRKDFIAKPQADRAQIVLFGVNEAIYKMLSRKDYAMNDDPVRNIKEWILVESIAEPDKVATPIDILRIDGKKAEWLQHKQECPDIQNSTGPAPGGK